MKTAAQKPMFPGVLGIRSAIAGAAEVITTILMKRLEIVEAKIPIVKVPGKCIESCGGGEHHGAYDVWEPEMAPLIALTDFAPESRDSDRFIVLLDLGRGIVVCHRKYGFLKGVTNTIEYHPDVGNMRTDPVVTVRFGEYALSLLHERPIIRNFHSGGSGEIAGVGEEFCRSCGHVAPTWRFRSSYGGCPSCRNRTWWVEYS